MVIKELEFLSSLLSPIKSVPEGARQFSGENADGAPPERTCGSKLLGTGWFVNQGRGQVVQI